MIFYLKKLLFFSLLIVSYKAAADATKVNPTHLIEVNSKTKAQCIEYFEIKGKTLCSTKPLAAALINQDAATAEQLNLTLSKDEWKIAWADIKPELVTIEYIRYGQTLNDWKEMITTQYFPNLPLIASIKTLALNFINQLQQKGFNPATSFYVENNNELIYEYQIFSPETQVQDEIQKIIRKGNSLYIFHYCIKQNDMGDKMREKWLNIIKNINVKQ